MAGSGFVFVWFGCLVVLFPPLSPLIVVHLLVGALAIMASAYDWETGTLPLELTLPAMMFSLAGYGTLEGSPAILGCFGGFLIFKSTQILCRWRYKKECLGTGDCLLVFSLGGMVGDKLLTPAVISSVIAVAVASRFFLRPQKRQPFGPFLTFGFLATLIIAKGAGYA